MDRPEFSLLKVVQHGFCIGCGACYAFDKRVAIVWNDDGFLEARFPADGFCRDGAAFHSCARVCPFSEEALLESALGSDLFSVKCPYHSNELGWFLRTYVGAVNDPRLRAQASSGGIARWILQKLVSTKQVDACVHVMAARSGRGEGLFSYAVSSDPVELRNSAQSAYYPVTLQSVLDCLQRDTRRYAVTAVPCFAKALRLLQRENAVLRDRIRFVIGLFCGHLKSSFYAEMLAWQIGIKGNIKAVTFRDKTRSTKANEKGFVVWTFPDNRSYGPCTTSELFGAAYNLGFFQHKACDYCDDVVAELADLSVGDAWLPEYVCDARGTSVVIVRDPLLNEVLQEGRASGELWLEPIAPSKVIESQAGGFRHKREGLAFRLHLDYSAGIWHPPKRVHPRSRLSRLRQRIYLMRRELREQSFRAFRDAKACGDFQVFRARMEPLAKVYANVYRPSFFRRVLRKVFRIFF